MFENFLEASPLTKTLRVGSKLADSAQFGIFHLGKVSIRSSRELPVRSATDLCRKQAEDQSQLSSACVCLFLYGPHLWR